MDTEHSPTGNPWGLDPLLDVGEFAAYLRVPVSTVYDWRTRGLGPRAYRFEKLEAVPPTLDSDDIGERLVHALNFRVQRVAEQTALTEAMIVAFFAYLERCVTLALPFTDADLSNFDLSWFLKATWSEKFKNVLDLSSPGTKKLYDRLLELADNYRNTRPHGLDKRGSTMGVFSNRSARRR